MSRTPSIQQVKPRLVRGLVRIGFFIVDGWSCSGAGYQGAGHTPKEAYESWRQAPAREFLSRFTEGMIGGSRV